MHHTPWAPIVQNTNVFLNEQHVESNGRHAVLEVGALEGGKDRRRLIGYLRQGTSAVS